MPITASDLKVYSSANVPEDDATTSGGGIDTSSKPDLVQWSATNVAAVVSDGADTRQVTITGRLSNGNVDTEVLTLNGTTEVVGTKQWERVLKITLSAADANRTVTVREGSGGPTRATIGPNQTKVHIMFQRSVSDPNNAVSRYEKFFWKNENPTLSLQNAKITLTADPSAKIRIGLASTKDDTSSVANRKTAPSGVTFVDDNVAISVPGGFLGPGESIGVWVEQTLAAGDAPLKSSFTTQISGEST